MIEVASALFKQMENLRLWLQKLAADDWLEPSVLPGWSIHELVAHLVIVQESLLSTLDKPSNEVPQPLGAYVSTYSAYAEQLELSAQQRSSALSSAGLEHHLTALEESIQKTLRLETPAVLESARGPITRENFLRTRIIELVVHSDDLARSLPQFDGPALDKDALKIAVSCLVEAHAQQHPGNTQSILVPGVAEIRCSGMPGAFTLSPMEALGLFAGRIPIASLPKQPVDPSWAAVLS